MGSADGLFDQLGTQLGDSGIESLRHPEKQESAMGMIRATNQQAPGSFDDLTSFFDDSSHS